jgi:AcrR family transcriptional regulator
MCEMAPEYSGGGDPRRTIALLWGIEKKPTRGPKPALSVERIAMAAIEVADAEGMGALSMRRVAERLGISTMSLYTYVPGKAELVDVMLDTAFGELAGSEYADRGWRAGLERIAHENWSLYHRHPWMLQVAATSRPPLGPNVIAKYDRELLAVDGIGLTEVEMDSVLALVLEHAQGAARRSVEVAEAEKHTGKSDHEWWRASEPLLEEIFDPDRYPTASRVGPAAAEAYGSAYDPEYSFEFGLQRLLDGIETLVRSRSELPDR